MEPDVEQAPEPELDLPIPDVDASSDAALRAAFHTLPIARRMTFHQAMAVPLWAIAIRGKATAIARRQQGGAP